ncbi:hypothetical protein TrRE_jg9883 [Triparma retinervis]|uniref:Silicon transporter n=1 Tax=Triparma retinervis TaxID=2557542 RepID=A0A9W7CE52_9STRA|nr:hypothetical protein TrRE_jg9883 [Triparma retinervis]
MALIAFCVTTVMAAIGTQQTAAADNGIPVGVAIPLFWVLILWLALIEGGQGALVGLQPTPKADYAQSHPISHKCTTLAHDGDNMERFIVGRQFLVVLQIFVINLCGAAIGGASVLNFNDLTSTIFLANGVAMILTTIVLGQLTSQVNAADCMLDFINNYFMLFSTYFSLAIEASGLLHAAYLVQNVASLVSGKPIETNEPPRDGVGNLLFWGRVLFSLAVLGFSLAVVFDALFKGWTGMWEGVPPVAAIFIIIIVLMIVGVMEGMQIAAFAVVKLDAAEYRHTHKIAAANCDLLFRGSNLGRFLIGRQVFVCTLMFVAARCFSINKDHEDIIAGSTSFEASPGFQEFINTGLLGAVVTTILGCLIWRIFASNFPLAFLSNPLIYVIIRICLALEATGLCSAAWVLGKVHKEIVDYQPDAVRLEGAPRQVTRRDKDIEFTVDFVKYLYSLALLAFSVTTVMAAIGTQQTAAADNGIPVGVAIPLFWVLILWLALIEGGQGALIGLMPTPKDEYAQSHPISLKCTTLAHDGDNMERFIVGRQFLVVLQIFVINLCGAAIGGASGWTGMWEGVPPVAAIFIIIIVLGFVGIMEGMQIAAFAVVKLDAAEYRHSHKIAAANCDLLFRGKNLGRFLIGRQVFVCTLMFVAARCFSINKDHEDIIAGSTSFEASPGFQEFINTGLLGAVVTTILGCLIWRIFASNFPLAFLSNPLIYVIIRICLAVEATGLCASAWALGKVHKKLAGYKPDSAYLDARGAGGDTALEEEA